MSKVTTIIGIAAVAAVGWFVFGKDDPRTNAKVKCEYAIETLTGYDIGIFEVSRAIVTGDIFNGRVVMPFEVSGIKRQGECVFALGETKSVKLDGQLLAGE